MNNNTIIRIKVPKMLYESALKTALQEISKDNDKKAVAKKEKQLKAKKAEVVAAKKEKRLKAEKEAAAEEKKAKALKAKKK